MNESLGVYIHIPFCIQRCHYCDFATYAKDQISPNQDYVETICQEIKKRKQLFPQKTLSTIYFGGGTPSLLSGDQIAQIISQFHKEGFLFQDDIEITLEVNPATLTEVKITKYKKAGVNRISIGCQSFNDEYLKNCNREHNSKDTFNTIKLVSENFDNYSLDLLFSLPYQNLETLQKDIEILCDLNPPHISAYCLTVPDKHPMNQNRCSEDDQRKMFYQIQGAFNDIGLDRYEISNFAKPGFESRHNNLYWEDKSYWGIGLSAHSYFKEKDWGYRFWNASTYDKYISDIESLMEKSEISDSFNSGQWEKLSLEESLSDYCHTHLRLKKGLSIEELRQKYGQEWALQALERLIELEKRFWVQDLGNNHWNLTEQGVLVSNQVFAEMLFSGPEIDK